MYLAAGGARRDEMPTELRECLALFQAKLRGLIAEAEPLFYPKPDECGVIIRNTDPRRRLVGRAFAGKGMPKEVRHPFSPDGHSPKVWFCKSRVLTRADLSPLLVTTEETEEDPDTEGRRTTRKIARFREFPEWDHEVLAFHFDGEWTYWTRHGEDMHDERAVRAMSMMILEHQRAMAHPVE